MVFIDRPLVQIVRDVDSQSRPLLAEGRERLYGLYQERYPLYCQAAHVRVVNDKSAQEAVKAILEHQSIIRGENQ